MRARKVPASPLPPSAEGRITRLAAMHVKASCDLNSLLARAGLGPKDIEDARARIGVQNQIGRPVLSKSLRMAVASLFDHPSALASSAGGTVRPSALAVLRLIASSNLVGCCTGRSAGFSPLRIRSA